MEEVKIKQDAGAETSKDSGEYELLHFDHIFEVKWILTYETESKRENKEFTSWRELMHFINGLNPSTLKLVHFEKQKVATKFE